MNFRTRFGGPMLIQVYPRFALWYICAAVEGLVCGIVYSVMLIQRERAFSSRVASLGLLDAFIGLARISSIAGLIGLAIGVICGTALLPILFLSLRTAKRYGIPAVLIDSIGTLDPIQYLLYFLFRPGAISIHTPIFASRRVCRDDSVLDTCFEVKAHGSNF
ncbi:MAG: hypothetical protein HY286_15075 [Planctomycetes bacterium]|nr:hypothetical protein [Planctomycetota bacterium]